MFFRKTLVSANALCIFFQRSRTRVYYSVEKELTIRVQKICTNTVDEFALWLCTLSITLSRSDVSWDTVLFKVVILDTKISWRWIEIRKYYILHICNLLFFRLIIYKFEIFASRSSFLWKIILFFVFVIFVCLFVFAFLVFFENSNFITK